jgi:hypothetical protein
LISKDEPEGFCVAGDAPKLDRQLNLGPGEADLNILIDETGLSTKMARRRRRAIRGERCRTGVPHGHGKTTFTGGASASRASPHPSSMMER